MPLVFAYGSNMHERQMARRCPGAKPVCVATLHQHRLAFVGHSQHWGGGVATVVPDRGSSVKGVVWRLSWHNVARLDGYEGVPCVYDRVPVTVIADDAAGAEIACDAYVRVRREPEALPSAAYLLTILGGYRWASVTVPRQLERIARRVSARPA